MSGGTGRPSSRDVAHEAEDTRAHLASTLEQLRTNLRPENVVDEVMNNARAGAASVADSLLGVARANPIPSLLIAAGTAVVFGVLSRGKVPGGEGGRVAPDHLPRATLLSEPPSAGPPASIPTDPEALGGGRRSTSAAGLDGLKRQTSDADAFAAATAEAAVPTFARALPHDRAEVRSKLSNLLDDQPLILGAIGLAIGAAIGAALPITEAEDSLMGGPSHQLRQAATDAARHEVDGLRAVASEAVENIRKSAVDHGLSGDNVTDLAKDVGHEVKAAAGKAGAGLDA